MQIGLEIHKNQDKISYRNGSKGRTRIKVDTFIHGDKFKALRYATGLLKKYTNKYKVYPTAKKFKEMYKNNLVD